MFQVSILSSLWVTLYSSTQASESHFEKPFVVLMLLYDNQLVSWYASRHLIYSVLHAARHPPVACSTVLLAVCVAGPHTTLLYPLV